MVQALSGKIVIGAKGTTLGGVFYHEYVGGRSNVTGIPASFKF